MTKSLEFYFDFISPYSFLAHKQIRKIEKENSIQMKYMPIFLGGLFLPIIETIALKKLSLFQSV